MHIPTVENIGRQATAISLAGVALCILRCGGAESIAGTAGAAEVLTDSLDAAGDQIREGVDSTDTTAEPNPGDGGTGGGTNGSFAEEWSLTVRVSSFSVAR